MWIKSLNLNNVRSYESETITFSRRMNILIGPNNAGKSTILLPILGLQDKLPSLGAEDCRVNSESASAVITFDAIDQHFFPPETKNISFDFKRGESHGGFNLYTMLINGNRGHINRLASKEPRNLIYPFLSKRKVTQLDETTNSETVESVPEDFENLNAKIDRLSDPTFLPAHDLYMRACDEILGFRVTSAHTQRGKRGVFTVRNKTNIPLLAMGEGVMNILGLVVHLALADDRLFVIEEPENDVHPKALKGLLDLICEKSKNNQFIITTHSNIVLKRAGSFPESKVFQVSCSLNGARIPTSTVRELGNDPEDRRLALSELGYDLQDVDIWGAWLMLEESSAEKLIRNYFIPWYVPKLQNRLRTFSARSVSEVAPKFRDFNDLFVFLHLEPVYKNKVWVLVDGGEEEGKIIKQIKDAYCKSGWSEQQFQQLSKHDFEHYYPECFRDDVNNIVALTDKQAKRAAKKALLEKVEKWIAANQKAAEAAFATSAAEVIEVLRRIDKALEN